MFRQPYRCDKCKLESEVLMEDNTGVHQGVGIISEDHNKLSPNCKFDVANIVVYQPVVIDRDDI